jgi:lysophospholipase L1-like esterase
MAQRTWDTIPNLPDHYRQKTEAFNREPLVKGKVVFLGNSITEMGNWKKMLLDSSVINRGIGGDITFGIIPRLSDVIRRQPSRLFLMIGINDLSKGIPDEVIMENVFSIVRKIRVGSPSTKIFLQSILPTNSSFKNFPAHYDKNAHVDILNKQFQKYADRLGFVYVDLNSKFLDKSGRLEASYSVDGLHLSPAGYAHWVEILKSLGCL